MGGDEFGVVRRQQDGGALRPQRAEQRPEFHFGRRIHSQRWLIQEEHARANNKHRSQGRALALASGEISGISLRHSGEPET